MASRLIALFMKGNLKSIPSKAHPLQLPPHSTYRSFPPSASPKSKLPSNRCPRKNWLNSTSGARNSWKTSGTNKSVKTSPPANSISCSMKSARNVTQEYSVLSSELNLYGPLLVALERPALASSGDCTEEPSPMAPRSASSSLEIQMLGRQSLVGTYWRSLSRVG